MAGRASVELTSTELGGGLAGHPDAVSSVVDTARGSGVLVETTGRAGTWTTVGVHGNVVEAPWPALVDGLDAAALRDRAPGGCGTADPNRRRATTEHGECTDGCSPCS